MAKAFTTQRLIRFSHCDPAGIVFFVHFFEMISGIGDTLVLELTIARLGGSSIEFDIRGRVQGDEKFRARHKVAMVSLESFRAMPIPAEMRARMLEYRVPAPADR